MPITFQTKVVPAGGWAGSIAPRGRALALGTRVAATIRTAMSPRTCKPGHSLRATVSRDVEDALGVVVIPAGSMVMLTTAQLSPADAARPMRHIALVVRSVIVNHRAHPVTATLEPLPADLVARGRIPIVFALEHSLTVRARVA